jgi:hypothetical protein
MGVERGEEFIDGEEFLRRFRNEGKKKNAQLNIYRFRSLSHGAYLSALSRGERRSWVRGQMASGRFSTTIIYPGVIYTETRLLIYFIDSFCWHLCI